MWALPSSFSLLASSASSSDGGAGSGFGGGSFSSTVLGAFFAAVRLLVEVLFSYLTSILGATPPARDGGAASGRPPVGVGVATAFLAVRAGLDHSLERREIAPVGAMWATVAPPATTAPQSAPFRASLSTTSALPTCRREQDRRADAARVRRALGSAPSSSKVAAPARPRAWPPRRRSRRTSAGACRSSWLARSRRRRIFNKYLDAFLCLGRRLGRRAGFM